MSEIPKTESGPSIERDPYSLVGYSEPEKFMQRDEYVSVERDGTGRLGQYRSVEDISEGYIELEENDGTSYHGKLNEKGELVPAYDARFIDVWEFRNVNGEKEALAATVDGRYIIIDENGNEKRLSKDHHHPNGDKK